MQESHYCETIFSHWEKSLVLILQLFYTLSIFASSFVIGIAGRTF